MAATRKSAKSGGKKGKTPRRAPARTPEAREKQLIAMSMDLAEERIRNGTASNQLLVHFLKLGSTREKKEQEFIDKRNENLDAKTKAIYKQESVEKLYQEALDAMRIYSGQTNEEELSEVDEVL